MKKSADKSPESKSRSVANAMAQQQGGGEPSPQFEDHRQEAATQRKLQTLSKNMTGVNAPIGSEPSSQVIQPVWETPAGGVRTQIAINGSHNNIFNAVNGLLTHPIMATYDANTRTISFSYSLAQLPPYILQTAGNLTVQAKYLTVHVHLNRGVPTWGRSWVENTDGSSVEFAANENANGLGAVQNVLQAAPKILSYADQLQAAAQFARMADAMPIPNAHNQYGFSNYRWDLPAFNSRVTVRTSNQDGTQTLKVSWFGQTLYNDNINNFGIPLPNLVQHTKRPTSSSSSEESD